MTYNFADDPFKNRASVSLDDCMGDIVRQLEAEEKLGPRFSETTEQICFGPKGALRITVVGPNRGNWYDREQQRGGGVFALIKEIGGYADDEEFDDWIRRTLGLYHHKGGGFNQTPPRPGDPPDPEPPPYRYPLVRFDDIELSTSARCIVEDLIPRESLVIVWGPPKCGKSFFVFDLMMHIALGREYRGKRVGQGTVVYIAAEGELGIKQRAAAYRQERLQPGDQPKFYLLTARLGLVQEIGPLIEDFWAQLADERPAAIVIDTLNRTLIGSESKDEDMAAYRDAADQLRLAFDCTVIIIHHCGISADRPRGHTSLTGAADAQLAVKRDKDKSILVTLEYMRDGPEDEMIRLALEVVGLGLDDHGKEITSCVVKHLDAPTDAERAKLKKLPPAQARALEILRNVIASWGEPLPTSNDTPTGKHGILEDLWRRHCYLGGISAGDTQDAKAKAFKRSAEALLAAGQIGSWDGWIWIP